MAQHFSNGPVNGYGRAAPEGVSLADIPKSNVFTSSLPADAKFPTPESSFKASRQELGPRAVRDALFTYVRPEEKEGAELLGVSEVAMRDIGLKEGEEKTEEFKQLVAGNKIMWDPATQTGIYPWAQCYGGWQFGSWAGQLGDGRAISLFESTNPHTKVRYEIQLKGAGVTPYSRFADGKAVLRSSIREFIVSEALNALKIPTTRALSLTLTPNTKVQRERTEPGAIVCRFASTWLRIGTFDILRARGDRKLIRQLATYLAEHVFSGWDSLQPASPSSDSASDTTPLQLNRFAHLYNHIARLNALTVAAWQAYAFTNGVLNTDNTSLAGLSLDFGPFAFLDNFDASYTPNHDDHALRYSYRNQPSIIWWNLVRLGESLGELIGAGDRVDDKEFVDEGVAEDWAPELITRAETIIQNTGSEFQAVFLNEYKRLMTLRLGLKTQVESDFNNLFSELLDTMEALELDFHHFFRRLSSVRLSDLNTSDSCQDTAGRFFHAEGITGGVSDSDGRARVGKWLEAWAARVKEDWDDGETADVEREKAMKSVNPKFVPRGWVLDEVIKKVGEGDREILGRVMKMATRPFEDAWTEDGDGVKGDREEAERWCGDVPRTQRGLMCSCSS